MASASMVLSVARLLGQDPRTRRSLGSLARQARLSPGHLQREFARVAGESPLRYARRVRLAHAAARLLATDAVVAHVAMASGFGCAEVLIRNFKAQFGCTPNEFRRRNLAARRSAALLGGLKLATRLTPCAPFLRIDLRDDLRRSAMPMLSTTLRTLDAQPALVIRSRVPRSAIAATIGASLGRIVPYALGAGGVFTGQPFARYPEFGPGNVSMEVGMPLAAPVAGKDDIEPYTLPAGLAAVAIHGGPYEQMPESYAALEQWIAAQGRAPVGAPWEVYVSDPAEHPDPADWRTEICWPVR